MVGNTPSLGLAGSGPDQSLCKVGRQGLSKIMAWTAMTLIMKPVISSLRRPQFSLQSRAEVDALSKDRTSPALCVPFALTPLLPRSRGQGQPSGKRPSSLKVIPLGEHSNLLWKRKPYQYCGQLDQSGLYYFAADLWDLA